MQRPLGEVVDQCNMEALSSRRAGKWFSMCLWRNFEDRQRAIDVMKVLIVEDDQLIALPIKEELEQQKYLVDLASDGQVGWNFATSTHYDLILLDLMLPKIDGIELCYRLRQSGFKQPILMMTARGTTQDKVTGLDSGADDYLVKPFELEELSAHVRALLRRQSSDKLPVLSSDKLTLNLQTCEVVFSGNIVDLTPTEFRLLAHFLRNPNHTFHPRDIIERLWLSDQVPTESVIKMHIKVLRDKLAAAGCERDMIQTVHGFGYRLKNNASQA